MSIKFSRGVLLGTAAAAAAALGLAAAVSVQAQPYGSGDYMKSSSGDMPYAAGDYGYDSSATVGGITVYASPRHERTAIGAPIVTARVSRVVDTSDLDLGTGYGMHELRARVESAATDACNQLDNEPGLTPLQGDDADCYHRAVGDAMAQVEAPY
jgi:UrcA family protein